MTNTEPGQHDFVLTPENKPAVKAWLIAQGIDPARVEKMRKESLQNACRYPQYLRAMLTRRDYTANGEQPCSNTCGASTASTGKDGESSELTTSAEPPQKPQPIPSEAISADNTSSDALKYVTEARVIELIREHAIPILIQRLQLGEL